MESRPGLAGSSGSGPLPELQSSCWLGHSHLKAQDWYDVLPSSFSGCWQDSIPPRQLDGGPPFLAGCWLEDTLTFLPLELLQLTACFSKARENLLVSHHFHNLIIEVTSITFSYVLFIRSKSLVQPTLKERLPLLPCQ